MILIDFIESFNDEMALLVKMLKPEKVIYVTNIRPDSGSKLEEVMHYTRMMCPDVKVDFISYEEENLSILITQLRSYLNEEVKINMAGMTPLEAMLLSSLGKEEKVQFLYPSIRTNKLYTFHQDIKKEQNLSEVIGNLAVDDLLSLSGGIILKEAGEVYETPVYKAMLVYLLENDKRYFLNVRDILKPSLVYFAPSYEKEPYFEFALTGLDQKRQKEIEKCMQELKEIKFIKEVEKRSASLRIYTRSKEEQHYLTSGAWLEHLTYHFMKELDGIHDVRTGFKFAWREEQKHIHNELDVVAMESNRFVGISCKDTDKYNYETLNELAVYATRLGGISAHKLLVTTALPFKMSTLDRAKQMDIEIIKIDLPFTSLKKQIEVYFEKTNSKTM